MTRIHVNGSRSEEERSRALAEAIAHCLRVWDEGDVVLIVRLHGNTSRARYERIRSRVHELLEDEYSDDGGEAG